MWEAKATANASALDGRNPTQLRVNLLSYECGSAMNASGVRVLNLSYMLALRGLGDFFLVDLMLIAFCSGGPVRPSV